MVRSQDPVETIRIESDLVDLKVSVLGFTSDADVALLEQKDFQVLEDGLPQEISFFAAADAPFDLGLLLDVSGSTSSKLKLVRRSAKRFAEAARPSIGLPSRRLPTSLICFQTSRSTESS